MYLRFVIALISVIAISLLSIIFEQENERLRSDLDQAKKENQVLQGRLEEARDATNQQLIPAEPAPVANRANDSLRR